MPNALVDPRVLTVILTALGGAIAWLWSKYAAAGVARKKEMADLQNRVFQCEQDRAVLRAENAQTAKELAVERGRVDVLTDLFAKEANLG